MARHNFWKAICGQYRKIYLKNWRQNFDHPYLFDLVQVWTVQHLPCKLACSSLFQLDLDELWSKRVFRILTPTLDVERDTTDNKSGCSNNSQTTVKQQSNNSQTIQSIFDFQYRLTNGNSLFKYNLKFYWLLEPDTIFGGHDIFNKWSSVYLCVVEWIN